MISLQHLGIHSRKKGLLALEMPIERRLLHAEALGDQPRRKAVDADFVQNGQRRIDDLASIDFHPLSN